MFNEEQKKAINWVDGPCLVLGTPGSGKTTVIINRIKHLIETDVNPAQILVITFTRAAAESMQRRFLYLMNKNNLDEKYDVKNVRFGTFHSFFYWILRTVYRFGQDAVISEEEKKQMIKKLVIASKLEYENVEDIVLSVIRQIELINCDMIDIDNYYSKDMPETNFRQIYRQYADEKKKLGRLDFDDMLSLCYELLTKRNDILESIRRAFPYIMVDEFQDTNRIQYEILKLMAHPADNIFVVGDDDQSIYGFRGARPDIMLGFGKEFKGTEIITLKLNYRCPKVVTECSSLVIEKNKKRYDKDLKSAEKHTGDILIEYPKDVKNENEMIVSRIRENYIEGVKYSDMAVLYRTNMDPRRLIYKLREYNIPFTVRDAMPNMFQHFAVVALIDYIKFSLGDMTRDRFLRIMNKPVRYISRDMVSALGKDEKIDFNKLLIKASGKTYLQTNIRVMHNHLLQLAKLSPLAGIIFIRREIGYDEYLKKYSEERNIDVTEFFEVLDEVQSISSEFKTYEEFFKFMDEYAEMLKEQSAERSSNKSDKDGVRLMTMHSAKGLEFKEVHIIECVEGIIPYKKSKTDAELEEERRMFYVGMTRTMGSLYLYAPKMINQKSQKVSRFITENIDEFLKKNN